MPYVFVEMRKPTDAERTQLQISSRETFWRAIGEDGTRFDAVNSTGWAVSSSYDWALRDSGLTGEDTMQIKQHYRDGFTLVEASPAVPVPADLRPLFEAAVAVYLLLVKEAA
jgi:hypothetical protein